jgi:RNA polymerase sigma-70 factor (ECF subfamily)
MAEFRDMYASELAYVVRTLRRLGVAAADVEDAAHDVFVAAYRRKDDRDPERPVRPWLFGIAFRVVGNYRQKAHRRHERGDGEAGERADDGMEGTLIERQQRALLLRALDDLDLDHRAAVVLHDLEGLAAPAIAELLDVPVNTIYSRVRVAREKLLAATRKLREP